jgi:hypothetical protein
MSPLRATASLAAALLVAGAAARDVPANVRDFVKSVRGQGACKNVLASGFFATWDDVRGSESPCLLPSSPLTPPASSYCGDRLASDNIIYLSGPNGNLVDMDIDCDGIQGGPADDGRCRSSGDTQSITSFQWLVESYGTGQKDLDANAHPYVVFGNTGSKPNWPTFDPREHGVEPLSVMAVVCGDKLVYGVWADENGDDGDNAMVGEASISLATACFGKSMNGDFGHSEKDVMYIAFPGADAVPGAKGAKWNAKNFSEFEASIESLGNKLIQRIGGGGGSNPPTQPPTQPPSNDCSWPGHCQGKLMLLCLLFAFSLQ